MIGLYPVKPVQNAQRGRKIAVRSLRKREVVKYLGFVPHGGGLAQPVTPSLTVAHFHQQDPGRGQRRDALWISSQNVLVQLQSAREVSLTLQKIRQGFQNLDAVRRKARASAQCPVGLAASSGRHLGSGQVQENI